MVNPELFAIRPVGNAVVAISRQKHQLHLREATRLAANGLGLEELLPSFCAKMVVLIIVPLSIAAFPCFLACLS